ncbi:MAG: GNAT family N-acetyltransferase [archaeon]
MAKIKLRAAVENDAKFIFEMTSDEDYRKYYLERLLPKSAEDEAKNIRHYFTMSKKGMQYYFVIMDGKEDVGIADIYKISKEDKRCAIGYGVKREKWGKGIASAAVKEIVQFTKKLGMHTCEATADPKNVGSRKVLLKNGFESKGVLKDYYFNNGKYEDRELFWKILG